MSKNNIFKYKKIKKVLIFGASSGLGLKIAEKIARENIDVILLSRNEKKLKLALNKITKFGSGAKSYLVCDVSSFENVRNVVGLAKKELGDVDCLINSAGVSIHDDIDNLTSADFDEVVGANLKGVFNCAKAIWPIMKNKNNGQLVFISSASGFSGYPTGSIYCASKSGVNTFLESLAAEGREVGIRIFNICPGQVNTPIWNKNDKVINKAKKGMLDTESIADLVWYLINRPSKEFFPKVVIQPFSPQPNLRGRNRASGGVFKKI